MAGGFRVPHTLILIFGMIVLAWGLTWVLPQGSFERVEQDGHEVVVPGSYAPIDDRVSLPWYTPFVSVMQGFKDAGNVIFFVFIIGGAFGIFRATGAADALIGLLLERFADKSWLLIGGTMALFAVGSSTIGMAEEYLPFVPMLLALCIALRFDSIVAIGTLCIGYGVGYGAAAINPFTVLIAWEVAGIQPSSGDFLIRAGLLVIFLAIGFHHVWRYATRVRADPASSLVHGIAPPTGLKSEYPRLSAAHLLILASIVVAIALVVYMIDARGWYLVEMGATFLVLSFVIAIFGRLGANNAATEFCKGATELTTTALLIGFARTIEVVLSNGQIIDTIVNGIAQPLKTVGPSIASVGMLFVQSLCNLFIPSGSGQAYVTMPIMAPLADQIGLSRQVAVLAYQFGDGFTNIVVPTNAVLIGILTLAHIPYEKWLRFILPFFFKIFVAASIVMVLAVLVGY